VIDLFVLSTYAGRQCPAHVERKMLHGNIVKICTPDFDATVVTHTKRRWFHSIETTFGWARVGGGPLQPCATRCAGVLSV
jgi:hypothetical protein